MGQVKRKLMPEDIVHEPDNDEPDYNLRLLLDARRNLKEAAATMSVKELSASDINEELDNCEHWLNAIRSKQEDRDA
jgi:hypothetical protein